MWQMVGKRSSSQKTGGNPEDEEFREPLKKRKSANDNVTNESAKNGDVTSDSGDIKLVKIIIEHCTS